MGSSRTVINAIIGAVVGIVLSFVPFSTVLGGAVAGFLEGPDSRDGAIVGALTGLITFLPIVGGLFILFAFLGLGVGTAAIPVSGFALIALLVFVGAFFVLLYTVGLALLGGYVGAYLAEEYPDQRSRTRETIGFPPERSGRSRRVDPTQPPRPPEESPLNRDRAYDRSEPIDHDRDRERETE